MVEGIRARRITVIGAGNMGCALVRGLIGAGTSPEHITVTTRGEAHARALAGELGVRAGISNADAAGGADLVVIAVKPPALAEVAADLASRPVEGLLVSIVAGVTLERLEGALRTSRIVRAMPNLPATVHEGMTVLCQGRGASAGDLEEARALFALVGRVSILSEALIDAATAMSGSGPAYVFLFIEALVDAGVRAGLPRELATTLATQTVRGAATMLETSGLHPAQLKDRVASPGGTTMAGLAALESGGLRAALFAAVDAATRRAAGLAEPPPLEPLGQR